MPRRKRRGWLRKLREWLFEWLKKEFEDDGKEDLPVEKPKPKYKRKAQ